MDAPPPLTTTKVEGESSTHLPGPFSYVPFLVAGAPGDGMPSAVPIELLAGMGPPAPLTGPGGIPVPSMELASIPMVLAETKALLNEDKPKKRRAPPSKLSNSKNPPSMTSKAVIRAAMNERVRKLDRLSRLNDGLLTSDQRDEKKRLMTLEKNRRAAQISREKKKRYVESLEDRVGMMAKHLAALEMENNQLRALLGSYYPEEEIMAIEAMGKEHLAQGLEVCAGIHGVSDPMCAAEENDMEKPSLKRIKTDNRGWPISF